MATIKRRVRVSFFINVEARSEKDFQNRLIDIKRRILNGSLAYYANSGVSSYDIGGGKNRMKDVTFALPESYTNLKLK